MSAKKHGKYIIVYRNQEALRAGIDIANEYKQDAEWATGNGLLVLRSDIAELANDVSDLRKQRNDLLDVAKRLVGIIKAHDLESLSCDRDGHEFCECLGDAVTAATAAIANAIADATTQPKE